MPGNISIQPALYDSKLDQGNPRGQAQRVFQMLSQYSKQNGNQPIALLYAANHNQVVDFHKKYQLNPPELYVPSGGGQALFFQQFNQIVNQAVKKGQLTPNQIMVLPIATSLRGGHNGPGNQVTRTQLDNDLNFVEQQLKKGYEVFSFQGFDEQGTPRYAIGGGHSAGFYSTKGFPTINGGSQGEYVQTQLKSFEKTYNTNNEPTQLKVVKPQPKTFSTPKAQPKSTPKSTHNESSPNLMLAAALIGSLCMLGVGVVTSQSIFLILGVLGCLGSAYAYFNQPEASTSLKI